MRGYCKHYEWHDRGIYLIKWVELKNLHLGHIGFRTEQGQDSYLYTGSMSNDTTNDQSAACTKLSV